MNMNKENWQWLLLALIFVGLVGFGVIVINQSFQLIQVSKSLVLVGGQLENLSERQRVVEESQQRAVQPSSATPSINTIPETAPLWKSAIAKLTPCDAKKQLGANLPDQSTLEAFSLGTLLKGGFHVAQACYDTTNHRVAYILVKQQLTRPTTDSQPTCVDACDEVNYGTFDTITGDWYNVGATEHLGIYGEAYNQNCLIDKIVPGSTPKSDAILFYCGSGESGGMTTWYQYYFGVDSPKLVTVQTMTSLDPEKFDVKSPALLKLFQYKSNADMR